MRIQAYFNIPQAFPVRKLGIGKAEELIITGKPSDPVIALVLFNKFVKLIPWQMFQYLCKDSFPGIHRQPSPRHWEEGTGRKMQCKFKSKKKKMDHLISNINILHGGQLTLTG
jgi:hypothetical protein